MLCQNALKFIFLENSCPAKHTYSSRTKGAAVRKWVWLRLEKQAPCLHPEQKLWRSLELKYPFLCVGFKDGQTQLRSKELKTENLNNKMKIKVACNSPTNPTTRD